MRYRVECLSLLNSNLNNPEVYSDAPDDALFIEADRAPLAVIEAILRYFPKLHRNQIRAVRNQSNSAIDYWAVIKENKADQAGWHPPETKTRIRNYLTFRAEPVSRKRQAV